jgi:hypothetical protein
VQIETRDHHEARRCRRAQYSGYPAEVIVSGSTILGVVRSVQEEPGPRWIVTIIPTKPKNRPVPRRKISYLSY